MWSNPTLFYQAKSIEKSFLIHPLNTNNIMYCAWLTLSKPVPNL